jgi:hypothetical protein
MRRRGLWLIGLGAIVLAMPASAAAAPKPRRPQREIQQPMTTGFAYLGKSAGYEVGVLTPSSHVVLLAVFRSSPPGERPFAYSQAVYAVRPQKSIDSGVLRASFGAIGRINLRFRPSGKTKVGHTEKHCRGRSPQTEFGVYRGTMSLRGEHGYFRIHAHRASGTRSQTFRLSCARGQAVKDKARSLYESAAPVQGFFVSSAGGSIALLLAVSRRDGRYVYLRAAHMQGDGPGAEVQAGAVEREPGMAIGRSAVSEGGEGTLLTSLPGVHPATATLAPPAPFHGTADLVESSSTSHSWTGSLGVSFPGLDLPLTGSSFGTSLCVESPFKTRLPCDFRKLPLVAE